MSCRTMIVLAAADRYALSSERISIQAFSSVRIARRASIFGQLFLFICSFGLVLRKIDVLSMDLYIVYINLFVLD
jgi:hypothetical protein